MLKANVITQPSNNNWSGEATKKNLAQNIHFKGRKLWLHPTSKAWVHLRISHTNTRLACKQTYRQSHLYICSGVYEPWSISYHMDSHAITTTRRVRRFWIVEFRLYNTANLHASVWIYVWVSVSVPLSAQHSCRWHLAHVNNFIGALYVAVVVIWC